MINSCKVKYKKNSFEFLSSRPLAFHWQTKGEKAQRESKRAGKKEELEKRQVKGKGPRLRLDEARSTIRVFFFLFFVFFSLLFRMNIKNTPFDSTQ